MLNVTAILKMRQVLSILIVIGLCSCGQENESTKIVDSTQNTDTLITEGKGKKAINRLNMLSWEKYQDPLRNEILKRKDNKILKEGFLQEMYIRNVATVANENLFISIPFNLHGPDCGAPDCYSTDISFSFKFGDTLIFPKKIQFQEHEHGCIEKERKLSASFQLMEQDDKHVIYHSAKFKSTLVLFSSAKESGTIAYFFTAVEQGSITGKNVYDILKEFNEDDRNAIYPFTSWILTTNEYETFIN
jgi:hypothetical protein